MTTIPPTIAELNTASTRLSAAFTATGYAFRDLGNAANEAAQKMTDAWIVITFTRTRREARRFHTCAARQNRRPALLHNGRKP